MVIHNKKKLSRKYRKSYNFNTKEDVLSTLEEPLPQRQSGCHLLLTKLPPVINSTWGLYHESIIAPNDIDELQIYEFSFPFYLPKWFTKWPMFCIFTMLYWVRNNGFTYCSACTMNVKPIVKKIRHWWWHQKRKHPSNMVTGTIFKFYWRFWFFQIWD